MMIEEKKLVFDILKLMTFMKICIQILIRLKPQKYIRNCNQGGRKYINQRVDKCAYIPEKVQPGLNEIKNNKSIDKFKK